MARPMGPGRRSASDSTIRSTLERLLPVILFLLLIVAMAPPDLVAQTKKRGRSVATKTVGKKGGASRQSKRSAVSTRSGRPAAGSPRGVTSPEPKPFEPLAHVSFPDSTVVEDLADGVSHHRIVTPDGQIVNVLVLDIGRGARLGSYKALDRQDGLETALDITRRAASSLEDTVLAATNASFWSAGSISPIGPTITSGEVLEVERYKAWSSLLIFDDGTAAIERIALHGHVTFKGRSLEIDDVNRRGKSAGVIVYSDFYGDSLPRGSRKSDSAIIAEALENRVDASTDSTEAPLDTVALIQSWREERIREDREHAMVKIVCEFPKPRRRREQRPMPVVGEEMKLVVTEVDTGVVQVPRHGFVISPGDQTTMMQGIRAGDTIRLHYAITPCPGKHVRHVLTGTPRLVRDGKANPEYETEGSKARRFVRGELARTAVGISRGGDTLFLVAIDSPCKVEARRGMNLEQLAILMQNLGAYEALNFDGGGSTSMAVRGEMVSRQGEGYSRRRVSNALLVMKKSTVKKTRRVTSVDAIGADEGSTNR